MPEQEMWADLAPDPRMVAALDAADERGSRRDALTASRSVRNNWSNRFADACARMIADAARGHRAFRGFGIRPDPDGPNEPLTFVAGDRQKKVDVVVSSLVSGLQVGISLKGMNFRDRAGQQFDKNLTGRTYELQDEVAVIHRYQPAAFLVAIYFMPIAATVDKKGEKSPSSFARAVEHLRARTGRLDPMLPGHMDRADLSLVALYVPGDEEEFDGFAYADDIDRGVVRYFEVRGAPPRRGRPAVETTLDLDGVVDMIASESRPEESGIEWADPEPGSLPPNS